MLGRAGDHEIVANAAGLGGEQRVALPIGIHTAVIRAYPEYNFT